MTRQEKLEWIDDILDIVTDLDAKKRDKDFSKEEWEDLEKDVKVWLSDWMYNFCKHETMKNPTEAECKKEEYGHSAAQCLTCGQTTACWYEDGEDGREIEYAEDWAEDEGYVQDRTVHSLVTILTDFIMWEDEDVVQNATS